MNELIVLLVVAAAVVAPILLVLAAKRREVDATRSPEIEAQYAREGLQVAATGPIGAPVVSGALDGTAFVLELRIGGGSVPSSTQLSIDAEGDAAFEISREGSRTLSGRDLVAETFADIRSQEAVRALFALRYDTVELRRGKLRATRYLEASLPSPDALRKAVAQLSILRRKP